MTHQDKTSAPEDCKCSVPTCGFCGKEISRADLLQPAWRSIESARRDGKWVLLTEDNEVFAGYWSRTFKEWRDSGDIGCNGCVEVSPTHWMDLPLPPTDIDSLEG